jgi:phosphoribosylcarboxyaminoimidazole (NCAIR) mutase
MHTHVDLGIIAGAGGAAHLPGMVASMSPLPVIGVPVKSSNSIDGTVSYRSYKCLRSSRGDCSIEWV